MNFKRHRRLIERVYDGLATVKRNEPKTTEWGETLANDFNLVTVYKDVPCNMSQGSLSKDNQTETANEISYSSRLFINPEIVIKQGDIIEVTQYNRVTTHKAGEPFVYPSHQELDLLSEDYA